MAKTRVPAVEGLFTMDAANPRLLGGKAPNGSYSFPKNLGGTDPYSPLGDTEEVELSNRGRIWSYTNSCYPPPPPFVSRHDPFVPVTIAAVELDVEKMVVLGQVGGGGTPPTSRSAWRSSWCSTRCTRTTTTSTSCGSGGRWPPGSERRDGQGR